MPTTFDVVFTVSVLIHNARDDAARLLMEMRSLLRPEGYLLLIENQLVPFDLRENNWHGGCWVHDYVGDLAADSNVQVFHDVIQSHDVYKIEPVGAHGRSVSIVRSDGEVRPLDECERIKLSLPRLKVALQGLASELEQGDIAALEGQLHDFAETAETSSDSSTDWNANWKARRSRSHGCARNALICERCRTYASVCIAS